MHLIYWSLVLFARFMKSLKLAVLSDSNHLYTWVYIKTHSKEEHMGADLSNTNDSQFINKWHWNGSIYFKDQVYHSPVSTPTIGSKRVLSAIENRSGQNCFTFIPLQARDGQTISLGYLSCQVGMYFQYTNTTSCYQRKSEKWVQIC